MPDETAASPGDLRDLRADRDDRDDRAASADETTGDAQVDAVLEPLGTLDGLPVHEHAAVVDSVHRALQDRLADGPG
ncbi:MAG TPA: hypothetical protein VIP77_15265 [Jiangellaceae bacterium]